MLTEELIQGLNLEDYNNEFKGIIEEGLDKNGNRKEVGWLKELCAFANTDGGTLYVGVHSTSHEVLAIDHVTIDSLTRMVHRRVKEHVEPFLHYVIKAIPVPDTFPTRYILSIRVDKSLYPPVTLRFNGIGSIYVRHFGETAIATNEEIRYMILNSDQASYDTLPSDCFFNWDDFKTLSSWYKKTNEGKELTKKDLLNIGFMSEDMRLKKGALLFKDDYDSSNTYMECCQFSGPEKGSNVFRANEQIHGNILSCYEKSLNFIWSHSANGFIKTEGGRQNYFSFPKRSVMEGIVNAIGHRNYFLQGSQIECNLYPDRLEIISPGSLLGTRWLKKEKNLSSIPPMRRNELIHAVLSLLKIMDHKGSGFDKIEEEYRPYGDSFSPFADSDGSTFALTLPDLTFKNGPVQFDEFPNVRPLESLKGKHDLKILSFCYSHPKKASEIAEMLHVKASSYFRSGILKPLVEKGYLIENSNVYPATYTTSREKTHI